MAFVVDEYAVIGAIGAILIFLGFYRISIGRWTHKSFWYELDNLAGASLLVIYQMHLGAYISVTLNIVWAIVAIRGLSSFAERYTASTRKTIRKRRSKRT